MSTLDATTIQSDQAISIQQQLQRERLQHSRRMVTTLTAFAFSWVIFFGLVTFETSGHDLFFAPITWELLLTAAVSFVTYLVHPASRYVSHEKVSLILAQVENAPYFGGFLGFAIGGVIGRGLESSAWPILAFLVGPSVGAWIAWNGLLLILWLSSSKDTAEVHSRNKPDGSTNQSQY